MQSDLKEDLLSNELVLMSKTGQMKSRMDAVMAELKAWSPFSNYAFKHHTGPAWSCAITSDCTYAFTGSTDALINIWNVETKELFASLTGHTNTTSFLFVIKNDTVLVSGSWDCTIKLWDWRNKTLLNTLTGHGGDIYAMMVTDNEKFLLAGDKNKEVKVWDLTNNTCVATPFTGIATPFGLGYNHAKNEIVVGGFNEMVYIFNTTDYAKLTEFKSKPQIQCLTVTKDGRFILVGTRSNIIVVYNYADKTEYCTFSTHTHWIRNMIVLRDDYHVLTASPDKTMRIFNLKTMAEEFIIEGNDGFINGICISKHEQCVLAASSDGVVRIWDVGFSNRVDTITLQSTSAQSIVLSPDNRFIISGCQDGSLMIWSGQTRELIKQFQNHTKAIRGLQCSDDSSLIISGAEDFKVVVYNTVLLEIVCELNGHANSVHAAAISKDNKTLASGDQDMKIFIWDLPTKSKLKVLTGHTDTIFVLIFNRENKLISSGADKTFRIWSAGEFEELEKFNTNSAIIDTLALSPDESAMVYGDRNGWLYMWDFEKRYYKRKFKAHDGIILKITFWTDSNLFVSASNDKTIKVWSFNYERFECMFSGHTASVRGAYLTNDKRFIISAGLDKTVKFWNFSKIGTLESSGIGDSFESYLYTAHIFTKSPVVEADCQLSISPLRVNLVHIFSYLGYEELLLEALNHGAAIKTDEDNHSPLYYALERNSQDCINTIIRYLTEIQPKQLARFIDSTKSLKNDFERLLKSNSVDLETFIDALFIKITDVPNFGVPKTSLPCVHYGDEFKLDPLFYLMNKDEIVDEVEIPIQFNVLPFPIAYVKGSQASIEILDSIIECRNTKILKTEFVKTYVTDKWNSVWWFIMLMTCFMWTNIILMIILIVQEKENGTSNFEFTAVSMLQLVVNIILLLYEIVQMMSSVSIYFKDIWNLIDMCRVASTLTWIILQVSSSSLPENINILTWLMVALNFLRGLSGFRAFDLTRYYTRLIIRAFFDSIFFLLIFFYSTIAFGVLYYTTKNPDYNTFSIWQVSYELSMGSFSNTSTFTLEYLCFLSASIINVIIILNLLISILGDSFSNFQSEADQVNYLEMAEYVREIETIMYWNRDTNLKSYFHRCKQTESGADNTWEGTIRAMAEMIDELKDKFVVELRDIKAQNNKIIKKLGA